MRTCRRKICSPRAGARIPSDTEDSPVTFNFLSFLLAPRKRERERLKRDFWKKETKKVKMYEVEATCVKCAIIVWFQFPAAGG